MRLFFVSLTAALLAFAARAQTQNEVVQNPLTPDSSISKYVNNASASIFSSAEALQLMTATCGNAIPPTPKCDVSSKDFYAIIHVLLWADASGGKIAPKAQNWYVYHGGSLSPYTEAKRLYGTRTIYVLYVHLSAPISDIPYVPRYEIQITKTVPANLQDLFLLASLATPGGKAPANKPQDTWGGGKVEIRLLPSSVQVDPRYVTQSAASNRGEEISPAQTFNNEGKYWWDVSVGIPLKKISDLKFDTTNNVVTPTQTSTTNAFALIDLYYPKVDLTGTSYSYIPHPIVGVAMASQPLHKILVGGAIGLHYAEFYAGAMFVKQQTLSGLQSGSPATPQQLSAASAFNFKTQFTVGLNLPIRAAIQALKKTTTPKS